MGAFTYNFERIYPIDEQTEILLTELKSDSSIEGLPNEERALFLSLQNKRRSFSDN